MNVLLFRAVVVSFISFNASFILSRDIDLYGSGKPSMELAPAVAALKVSKAPRIFRARSLIYNLINFHGLKVILIKNPRY
jgi:hypothetical protein